MQASSIAQFALRIERQLHRAVMFGYQAIFSKFEPVGEPSIACRCRDSIDV
jgi:hypothetical protein